MFSPDSVVIKELISVGAPESTHIQLHIKWLTGLGGIKGEGEGPSLVPRWCLVETDIGQQNRLTG